MKPYSLALLALIACGGKDAPAPVIVPSLSIVEGDAQRDTVGRTLPVQLGAKLIDSASGAPLSGRVLNWSVVGGGGEVFAPITQTGSQGLARNQWTLGMQVGVQKLVARYIDPETGEAVTLDTAIATAVPNWNLTVNVVNQSSVAVAFSWQDGAAGTPVGDSIPAGITRCERLHAVSDSASLHLSAGASFYDQPSFAVADRAAWTFTITNTSGSPGILGVDTGPAC